MKVSEKSLELNVGAELLAILRGSWGMPKAYLRGLTQREEKQEGVDFFVQLNPATKLFAFQFKAPKGKVDGFPYRYTLSRAQHDPLFRLAELAAGSVFYVFPFYVTPNKLQQHVPHLIQDTWMLDVAGMPVTPLFGTQQTRTIKCQAGLASVNPEYKLQALAEMRRNESEGIPLESFARWYVGMREQGYIDGRRRNPWIVRGLRLAIVTP
jgi:hypothetical protein